MKYYLSILSLLMLTASLQAQNLRFSPDKPAPGEKIEITYDPAGTPLAEVGSLSATAYLLDGKTPKAVEVQMEKNGEKYIGKVETTAGVKGLFVNLQELGGSTIDNNTGKGYRVKFYAKDQSAPASGAYAAMAQAYGSFYRLMNIDRDFAQAMEFMKKEFKNYPYSRSEDMYIGLYVHLAQQTGDEEALADALSVADAIAANRKATEKESNQAYYLYLDLREGEKAEELAARIKKKYKKGLLVQREQVDAFYNAPDLAGRQAAYDAFVKNFGINEENKATVGNMAGRLAGSYGAKGQWDQFEQYIALVDDAMEKANAYNNLAWSMSGESLEGETRDLEQARTMSYASLQLVQKAMESGAGKPDYLTLKDWRDQLEFSYGMFADTYALIEYHLGNYEEALQYQQKACESGDFANGEMNERYAAYYEKVKSPQVTLAFLEDMIRKGTATSLMKEQHRRLFMNNYTLADAYDKIMKELGREAEAKMKEEMKKKMIDEAAPAFTLTDLDGQPVSIEDLKGKVVVLDFWATWCGPCKASFPGMQQAVNQHADKSDVAFLFINSWEGTNDKKKSAGDYIQQNNYTFRVLMDEQDEVVAKYKVEGIPTKFVLDKNGRIRFKSIGFGGNDEELVQEMRLMIEMARDQSEARPAGAE